ncbi:5'-nucleotidase C-terminal domain-containing protein [Halosquirtibacter xylanolyticus]|uniref:5'-nucleotidase C-terminal domain-containing protein n=1 Tax=Halosquirtibacter xylanolyticus TaxID=3374599 RepID=UPI00374803D9|nr:5'-nucleotidase C-terminal domain-containing protein [Prolixibacteraceae bacterium]
MKNRLFGIMGIFLFVIAVIFSSCKSNVGNGDDRKTVAIGNVAYRYITLDDKTSSDPTIASIISPFRDKLSKDMERVIGFAPKSMFKGRPEGALSNFCADLLLEESAKFAKERLGDQKVDFAMLNNGGLRVPINQGNITVENIFQLMPFENEVVMLQLNGKQVKTFLNHIASRGGESMAGVHLVIKDRKASKVTINGEKLLPEKNYWLITSDYIADGGDGSGVLKDAIKRENLSVKLRDLFINYIEEQTKAGKEITATLDGRIKNGK